MSDNEDDAWVRGHAEKMRQEAKADAEKIRKREFIEPEDYRYEAIYLRGAASAMRLMVKEVREYVLQFTDGSQTKND